MAAAVLLLLLGAGGALLYSTEAQEAYNQLPDDYRKGVDLVLKELGSYTAVRLHFRFFKTVQKSEIESGFHVKYISHNVLLKPTRCAKGTAVSDSSPQRCPFRDDRPMMDCTVCYKTFEAEIETTPKPYVHCIQRPKLTKEMTAARLDHCRKMSYITGSPSLLASEGLEPSK